MAPYQSTCYVYNGPGDVEVATWDLTCGPTDVMLRIDVCGRCGTDRRLFTTAHPRVQTPTVLGHELVGRVVEVGRDVAALTEGIGYRQGQTLDHTTLCPPLGQRVTVQPRVARYRDGLMLMEDPIQNLSFQIPGGYAQYMRVPAEMIRAGAILPIPDGVPDDEGALVEPTACALESIYATPHAIGVTEDGHHRFHSGVKPGGRTLVIGSGSLAMIYARLARIAGAGEVWLMVRSETKVALITAVLGDWPEFRIVPDYASLPLADKLSREAELEQELRDLTHGQLFDDVVLACPSTDAQRLAFRLLNPDGYAAIACFAGLHDVSEAAQVDLLHYRLGKAFGTSGCSTRTMETVIRWLASGRLSLRGLTSPHHYTLEDDPAEFLQTRADGRKPMLYPWE
jgi:L-iditol 2-dehydrogenase